ncbi:P-loop containing nucleoside triphosphate hydrolase protein [Boeremia exigua]|uniref:P-loop containing nucleoside triphosphate hydrolase protein n=1 Tax=Boeremia exigua TaxID=749465 RepID=UPI001E8EE207|nr:P-loop containing nucleoside triphosphate hydrolase protein [Boeremia exigua]KAH6643182.1 P-loop containing nucleoside triphosphate hydrolase protein [Boeremia exigua]
MSFTQDKMDVSDSNPLEGTLSASVEMPSSASGGRAPVPRVGLPNFDDDNVGMGEDDGVATASGNDNANMGTTTVELADLTPGQQNLIMANKPELYKVDEITDLSDVCALRGCDVPSGWSTTSNRRACVITTRKNMDGNANGKGTFLGSSIDFFKTDTQGQKTKPSLDRVFVFFHTDTQTPSIEITTRCNGLDADQQDGMISTHICAQDLRIDNKTNEVMFCVRDPSDAVTAPARFVTNGENPGNADVEELESLHKRKELFEITVVLRTDRSATTWAGLDRDTANKASDGTATTHAGGASTATRDLLIGQMGRQDTNVISFFMHTTPGMIDKVIQQATYMRKLFSVAAQHGNFWFYRNQLKLNKVRPDALDELELPKFNFEVPRWLVTEFRFDTTVNASGETVYSNPQPCRWDHFNLSLAWRNPDEAAFLLKMGIESERRRQTRELKELAQSDKPWFRGIFTEIEDSSGRYICEVFLNDESVAENLNVKMPAAGTRIRIRVVPKSLKRPNNASALSYFGSVTTDPFHSGAAFLCVLHGPKGIANAPLPVYISYTVDDVPYERQMEAVKQIQEIKSGFKLDGIDLKNLFLNDSNVADKTNYLMGKIDLAAFKDMVAKRPKQKLPNKSQSAAIISTATSKTGLTVVQGPPGTGKTETMKTIGMAMLLCGIMVMYAASTNAAVAHLAESFDKSCREEGWLLPHEYVLFTGAYVKIEAAERHALHKSMAESEEANVTSAIEDENTMQQFARTALLSTSTIDPALTFGTKLRQRIQVWAETSETDGHPMRGKANAYLRDLKQLPFEPKESKTALVEQLDNYEYNFGLWYLEHEVKAVFCTLSSSAHELLTRAFRPQELIIDEAAQASFAGLATAAGAYKDCIKHITLAGDHHQGKPSFAAGDSNVGHGMLSRNLFQEIAEDRNKQHQFIALETSYRCVPELLGFTKGLYKNLKADPSCGRLEPQLQQTLRAFWKTHVRDSFKGSALQVAIDIKGSHTRHRGTTTLENISEAKAIAHTVKAMLAFKPPEGGRQIVPADIALLAAYTGQVLAIRHELRRVLDSATAAQIKATTTTHAQGSEWNIVLISCVINLGLDRVPLDTKFPIGFVANRTSINVALSRARVGRYIFGGLQVMVQMLLDKHPAAHHKYRAFFEHLKALSEADNVVTDKEWQHAMMTGTRPPQDAGFARPKEFSLGLVRPSKSKVNKYRRGGCGGSGSRGVRGGRGGRGGRGS